MESARLLREGLEKTGRFQIISKEKGVPVVAFAFKGNDSKNLGFRLSKALRNYGWIVPAYTMPANAENVTALRVVVREDFGRQLVEKLLFHIGIALKEMTEAAAASGVGRIRFTVEMNADENEINGEGGILRIPAASVHWKHDHRPDTEATTHHQVTIMGGKTKGVC